MKKPEKKTVNIHFFVILNLREEKEKNFFLFSSKNLILRGEYVRI